MIHSFRLRLALLSALLCGLALVGFGVGSWWLIRSIKLERMGSELRFYAEREVTRWRSREQWSQLEEGLAGNLGVRDRNRLAMLVEDANGAELYRSPHWPAALDATRFTWPDPGVPPGVGPGQAHRFPNDFLPPGDRPPPDGEGGRAPPPPRPPTPGDSPKGQNPPWPPDQPPPRPRPVSIAISQSASGHVWRVGLASVPHARLAVAMDAQVMDAEMGSIRNAFLIALPFALALIGLGSWLFAARALRPIQHLTDTTRKVTAEGLNQRIDSKGEDREFVELIEVFNRMLGRLERSFKQATRFSADAAHELKTPLAIVQGQLERTINMAEDGSPMQEALTSILDETRRLSTISRKLLLLSQADAGRLNVHAQSFDLSKALEDLLEDTRMLAPHLKVTAAIGPGLVTMADGSLLRQVLHNLISNAIKYNLEPGWIHIATARWAQRVEVVVSNASHGIPVADRNKVFERFYRVDAAHSRQVEGVGLGLSVSREIARAHGGDLVLKADSGDAVHFSLLLPLL